MFLREDAPAIQGEDVLTALVNDHDRKILAAAQDQPVEASDILEMTDIPRSTLYRRIRKLEEKGLLRRSSIRIRDGHQVDQYRSVLALLELRIVDGTVETRWREDGARADQEPGADDDERLDDPVTSSITEVPPRADAEEATEAADAA